MTIVAALHSAVLRNVKATGLRHILLPDDDDDDDDEYEGRHQTTHKCFCNRWILTLKFMVLLSYSWQNLCFES